MLSASPIVAQSTATYRASSGAEANVEQQKSQGKQQQQHTVDVDLSNVSLAHAIDDIAQKAGVKIGYSDALLPKGKRVSLRASKITVQNALEQVLSGTALKVVSYGGQLAIVEQSASQNTQATGVLSGRVLDSASERGISGVTVSITGTKLSATTDAQGRFTIRDLTPGDYSVTFRLLGYTSASRSVTITESKPLVIQVTLKASVTALSGVVTTATGMKQRVEVGNAVTVLNVDEIRKTAPITSVTDLLVTRVPGMSAMRSTGSPGDPTRLRLRGTNSILLNNDPIVIVDGIRMYAEQTGARNANLTSTSTLTYGPKLGVGGEGGAAPAGLIPATSPLDRLDPNNIETIEVMSGPSASAIYGSDAANGVIIVTTKRGKAGPTRWSFDGGTGSTTPVDAYPTRYLRWGKLVLGGTPVVCPISSLLCQGEDSLITFNSMNDPSMSPLGRGGNRDISSTVQGGTQTIQYSLSSSLYREDGYLKLPGAAVEDYRRMTSTSPASWMRNPDGSTRKNASANLTLLPSPDVTVSYTTQLLMTEQSRSSLQNSVQQIQRMYRDNNFGRTVYRSVQPSGANLGAYTYTTYLPQAYRKTTSDANGQLHALQATWMAREWLTLSGTAGWDAQNRDDQSYLAPGLVPSATAGNDTSGQYQIGRATTNTGTLGGTVRTRFPGLLGIRMAPIVGFNYKNEAQSDVMSEATGLIRGAKTFANAAKVQVTNMTSDVSTVGVFFEPGLNFWDRYYFSPAIGFDAGTSSGSNAKPFALPKLSFSWLASDESWFPRSGMVDALKIRTAFGAAGKSPGAMDRYRLYDGQMAWIDGQQVEIATLGSFGNTKIRPERTVEWEGGLDADLYEGRLSFGLTMYHKTTRDNLMPIPVALSVHGGAPTRSQTLNINLGRVRNTGTMLTAVVVPVRATQFTWTVDGYLRNERNVLLHVSDMAKGLLPNPSPYTSGARYVEGYPLSGLWARRMVGYADINQNGIIEATEVQIGDSTSYIGPNYPNYEATISQTVALLNGRLLMRATVQYTDGAAQINYRLVDDRWFSRAMTHPGAPLAAQAAVVSMAQTNYSAAQIVSSWRFNEFSASYELPPMLVRPFRMSAGTISVQGRNLGLHTNYSGLDPNTNILSATENGVADAGLAPPPRMWMLRLRLRR